MVDQVATEIITVPMCLREEGSQGCTFFTSFLTCLYHDPSGFPPADGLLLSWFTSVSNSDEGEEENVTKKLHALMTSLLIVLCERLTKLGVPDGEYPVFSS
jgi:hypothetical protein